MIISEVYVGYMAGYLECMCSGIVAEYSLGKKFDFQQMEEPNKHISLYERINNDSNICYRFVSFSLTWSQWQ